MAPPTDPRPGGSSRCSLARCPDRARDQPRRGVRPPRRAAGVAGRAGGAGRDRGGRLLERAAAGAVGGGAPRCGCGGRRGGRGARSHRRRHQPPRRRGDGGWVRRGRAAGGAVARHRDSVPRRSRGAGVRAAQRTAHERGGLERVAPGRLGVGARGRSRAPGRRRRGGREQRRRAAARSSCPRTTGWWPRSTTTSRSASRTRERRWLPGADAWLGATWGTAADRAAVTADLSEAVAWASSRGVPLYVGRVRRRGRRPTGPRGCAGRRGCGTSSNASAIPWAYWDLATEFGAYDLERGAWDAELLDALVGAEGS